MIESGDEAENEDGEEEEDEVENEEETNDNGITNITNDEDDDDENFKIVGKKRKALEKQYDPKYIRRNKLIEYYTQYNQSQYSYPTSAMIVKFVQSRGLQNSPDLMWQCILGTTDQYLKSNINEDMYNSICYAIREEILTFQRDSKYRISENSTTNPNGNEIIVQGSEAGRVEESQEFRFFLYRHWSLFDSMYNSAYIAKKMAVWKPQGNEKLQLMLAKMGIPLIQAKQSFNFMLPDLRQNFRNLIMGSLAEEYNLVNPGVTFNSFIRYNSFRNSIAASDVVYAASALVELYKSDSSSNNNQDANNDNNNNSNNLVNDSQSDAFNKAYDCLGFKNDELLKIGINIAIELQKAIVRQATLMLEKPDAIIKVKKFRYAFISKNYAGGNIGPSQLGLSDADEIETPFARPMVLTRLGQILMDVQRENKKWIKKNNLPLILASERKNTFLIVGIAPKYDSDDESANQFSAINFGRLFKQAAREMSAKYRNDSFDSCVIEVHRDDAQNFIETLYTSFNR